MQPLVLHARRALTPLEQVDDAVVVVAADRIVALGRRGEIRTPESARWLTFPDCTIVPGFVDIHIHGAAGHDVMEATPEALAGLTSAVARFGTTTLLATTVTAHLEHTLRSLRGLADYILTQQTNSPPVTRRARIAGLHLEGPFINPARRGVHPEEFILAPSLPVLEQMLEAAQGQVKLLTLAPELPGALELVAAAQRRGLVVSMGHTDATYQQTRAAIQQGAKHAVHMFNAMRPFSHRETGVIGAVLTAPEVTAELIADGMHVHPAAMQLLLAAKGVDRVILVSDGTAATGMPDGNYRLGTFPVVVSGGVCRDPHGRLAGSTLTLDRALRNIVGLGVAFEAALRMVTLNPARLLGMDSTLGVLAPGAQADLVLLDGDLNIRGVMTRGTGLLEGG
jgi:N-acetylglucosamine-6-phosphate deacetylase